LLFQTAVPVGESIVVTNTVAAPGGGVTVVTTASVPPAGIYRIVLTYLITGAQELLVKNVRLVVNNAALVDCLSAMTFTSAIPQSVIIDRVTLDGVNVVKVTAAAAATGSTVYTATLNITRIG
jgi:hypothetical protein